jgi:hypothetical protein
MTMTTNKPEPMLWLSDARGVYIPRDFANSFADRLISVQGVDEENWKILEAGPDHELYWDAWDEVCRDATIIDDVGNKFSIHQDGDYWLIPDGMTWSDKADSFVWPDDEDSNDAE